MKPTVVIAGATGFIGRWFMDRFKEKYQFIALSRRTFKNDSSNPDVEWRQVELYSLSSTQEALKGADYAIYLVHSMQPSTRLNQATFDNTDLLLADNFARAAQVNGIQQIIFLGGLLPSDTKQYSRHLRSRYEVELTLSATGVPVTALRAGIIVGPGGSSFRIMEKLVSHLPFMIAPKWTLSQTQPISLDKTLTSIDFCLGNKPFYSQAFDIGGPERTTYLGMMKEVAALMNKKRLIVPVPLFSISISKLWVAYFAEASPTLVSPLVESLRHEMVASPNLLMKQLPAGITFKEAAQKALFEKESYPQLPPKGEIVEKPPERNTVRSVQRLPNPSQQTATWVARQYQEWLPRFFRYLITVKQKEETTVFQAGPLRLLELRFIKDRSDTDRQLFYIVGGLLVKRKDYGWLEFRSVLGGKHIMAAIHEYVPTLPWFIYVPTQALVHLMVMNRFAKYLDSLK